MATMTSQHFRYFILKYRNLTRKKEFGYPHFLSHKIIPFSIFLKNSIMAKKLLRIFTFS
jgi:hypothetical protein